jgi:hypothetical protein
MIRQLETIFITRNQHDAVLDAVRFEPRDSANRTLFARMTFQWSLSGAIVHGEPKDIATLREFANASG